MTKEQRRTAVCPSALAISGSSTRRRARRPRVGSSARTAMGRKTLAAALACVMVAITLPRPAYSFFRPSTRVKPPPPGPKSLSSVPQLRNSNRASPSQQQLLPVQQGQDGGVAGGRSMPSLMLMGEEAASEAEEQVVDEAEDGVGMPSIEVPEMMSNEERMRLWMAVSRADSEALRLERQGLDDEAAKLRERANRMRYEDPYTALQDQLDEAVKNEEFVKIARLRLQMRRIGVPPNAEMQARAEGRDPRTASADAARQMPGMTNRESEAGSKSGGRGEAGTVSDGYSSKSDTTTHGVRVEVRSQYYPEQSNPVKDQYIFVYKVKITNQSPQTVQLVSRTWEIKAIEATEAPQLVKGPGVVGQQPVLEPGQSFEYSSACPITCAPKEGYQVLGRMKGSYLIVMGAVGEAAFEAKIDPFYLILPQSVLDERAGRRGGGGGGSGGGGTAGGGDMAGNNW